LDAEAIKAGVLVDYAGLMPTTLGARIEVAGGKLSVVDGPFTEAKEVIGGYAIFNVKSRQEAIEWCSRFMNLHTVHWPTWHGEAELRQLFDPSACEQGPMKR
jgi:hypothetical protein